MKSTASHLWLGRPQTRLATGHTERKLIVVSTELTSRLHSQRAPNKKVSARQNLFEKANRPLVLTSAAQGGKNLRAATVEIQCNAIFHLLSSTIGRRAERSCSGARPKHTTFKTIT